MPRCNICSTTFGSGLPVGADVPVLVERDTVGAGLRSACPGCGSTDRDRLVALFLESRAAWVNASNPRLLHVAPEPSLRRLLSAAPGAGYVAGDLRPGHYGPDVVELDLQCLPFDSDVFDVVVCNDVLEHVAEDYGALREIRRVLKPAGFAILQVPIALQLEQTDETPATRSDERIRLCGQHDHVRLYGRDYRRCLTAAGFAVEVMAAAKYPQLVEDHILNRRECVFASTKQGSAR
jgi:SAM-dependent methyltransferase